jgi:hypothetical protein
VLSVDCTVQISSLKSCRIKHRERGARKRKRKVGPAIQSIIKSAVISCVVYTTVISPENI